MNTENLLSAIIKGIPGCFFTRTSLPKRSNNIEPISVLDSYFGDRGIEPQQNLLLCLFYFIFIDGDKFIELFRYILKLVLN